jgi:epoxyqueuosine reductase QueG
MDPKTIAAQKMAEMIEDEIKRFVRESPLNRMPDDANQPIFEDPLVGFADGNDPLFTEFKKIIGPNHLTPIEALVKAYNKQPEDGGKLVSVISWVLPVAKNVRESNREETAIPSRYWAYTKWYGEKFNDALRKHVVDMMTIRAYLTVAPAIQPYFKTEANAQGRFSNWSERHVAYAAGQGTFSLSDGFITDKGIAHRCGSIVVDVKIPASPRTARTPFSNCLYYVNKSCKVCISRCPAGAITESGHDKNKCKNYMDIDLKHIEKDFNIGTCACGLCQTKVPCEFHNPTKTLK